MANFFFHHATFAFIETFKFRTDLFQFEDDSVSFSFISFDFHVFSLVCNLIQTNKSYYASFFFVLIWPNYFFICFSLQLDNCFFFQFFSIAVHCSETHLRILQIFAFFHLFGIIFSLPLFWRQQFLDPLRMLHPNWCHVWCNKNQPHIRTASWLANCFRLLEMFCLTAN